MMQIMMFSYYYKRDDNHKYRIDWTVNVMHIYGVMFPQICGRQFLSVIKFLETGNSEERVIARYHRSLQNFVYGEKSVDYY